MPSVVIGDDPWSLSCQSGLELPLLIFSNYLWWHLSPLGIGQVTYPAEMVVPTLPAYVGGVRAL